MSVIQFPDRSRRLSQHDKEEIVLFTAGLRAADLEFGTSDQGHDLAMFQMTGEELCLLRQEGVVVVRSFGGVAPVAVAGTVAAALAALEQHLRA